METEDEEDLSPAERNRREFWCKHHRRHVSRRNDGMFCNDCGVELLRDGNPCPHRNWQHIGSDGYLCLDCGYAVSPSRREEQSWL